MVAPQLILDSRERWLPVPVEDSLAMFNLNFDDKKLDFPPKMRPSDFSHLPVTGYQRMVEAAGLQWHQFWLWWPYNPKVYAGIGAHEGDWEMVQFALAGDRPILASYAQHDGGEKREFWRVALDSDGNPLVYIARDSHAAYFAPARDVTDQADGKGESLTIQWRPFGDWANWDGKWGNSNNSPGALFSRRAWKAPHAWHGQCRG
jgi:hypothetical protein